MPNLKQDPGKPHGEPGSVFIPAWLPALAAAVLIVTIGSLTTWMVLRFDALRPKVGDMIVFVPTMPDVDSWQMKVATSAVSGREAAAGPCILDPNEMSAAGGSLIIEARQDSNPPLFQLHWAGRHTAKGAGDCGAAADLTLDRTDLQRIANAAGGFGTKPGFMKLTANP